MRAASTWLALLLFAGACAAEADGIRRQPVPPADRLRSEDCSLGIAAYRSLLERPPNAGVVVTGRPSPLPSPEEQERAVAEFAGQCHYNLVGQARRLIVRCWLDSADASSFRRCNDRF